MPCDTMPHTVDRSSRVGEASQSDTSPLRQLAIGTATGVATGAAVGSRAGEAGTAPGAAIGAAVGAAAGTVAIFAPAIARVLRKEKQVAVGPLF